MKKFFILFRKELKELLALSVVLPIIVAAMIFSGMGKLLGSERTKLEQPWPLAIVDQSQTALSKELIDYLSKQNIQVNLLSENNIDKATAIAQQEESAALLVIPKNFEEEFNHDQKTQIALYAFIRSFSITSTFGSARLQALTTNINEFLSNKRVEKHTSATTPDLLKNPVQFNHFTVIKDRKAPVPSGQVMAFIQSQTAFIPIILFMVIMFAAQMVATSIASEKQNKTLEILLSSPVNRKAIIFAKLLAAALVALLLSGIYIMGWNSYMGNLMGKVNFLTDHSFADALQSLGIIVNPIGYFLLGLSLFLSILCALAIAILLGLLIGDVKSVQVGIMPLMILILIPYLATFFVDVHSSPLFMRSLLYAIPFSHTFLAMQNVMMKDYLPIIYGIIYQAFFALIFIILAAKIFTSDKVLTLKFQLKRNP